MRRHKPELLCEAEAKVVEERILQNIKDAYRAEQRSDPPREFMEEPVGAHGMGEPDDASLQWTNVDDMFDLDQKLEQANVRDAKHARLLIDGHVYQEDVDESQTLVYANAAARRLLRAQQKQKEVVDEVVAAKSREPATTTTTIPFPETNAQGIKRPRWKYVAKVVNTRALKKKGRRITSYTNNNVDNTLVEHDGELRVATVEEAKQTAWKPTRTKSNEYVFEGVKRAWLDKTLQGKTDVWGRMPITRASEETQKNQPDEEEVAAAEDIVAADDGAEAEESSSSDESEEEEASEGEESEDFSSDSSSDEDEEDKEK
mmetsp:Transcript_78046/g.117447  ORF Transcript_78046/g.117447 Transcript_78046/m.117447 type:complete len:316 (-) Transcript_78046:36-983(-)